MPRLTALPQRLAAPAPRLGAVPGDSRARDRDRAALQPWRGWYNLARWKRLRRAALERDDYTCRATGVLLIGKAPAANSPVVDHIREHKGDPDLFWDLDNLQTVSKAWHDGEKQRLEAAARA